MRDAKKNLQPATCNLQPETAFVKTPIKIIIVVALAAAVVAIVTLKQNKGEASGGANDVSGAADARGPAGDTGGNTAPAAVARLPRLVDLGAGKCIPCKMMAPILEELKKEYAGRMEVVFIDVWQNPDAGKEYGIEVIPTQIFYDAEGTELFRHVGFYGREDILGKWKELGVDPAGQPVAKAPTNTQTTVR
jgi:thioredoxin 1